MVFSNVNLDNGLEFYQEYCRLHAYFSSPKFKFNQKIKKLNVEQMLRRSDKYFFNISKKQWEINEFRDFVVSNFVYKLKPFHISEIKSSDAISIYNEYKLRILKLKMIYENDLKNLSQYGLEKLFKIEGSYPLLTHLVLNQNIHLETYIGFQHWFKILNIKSNDQFLFPKFKLFTLKYIEFLNYNKVDMQNDIFINLIVNYWSNDYKTESI